MASLTSFFGGRFINELRGYVARQRRDATAYLTLPSGVVDVASVLPTGGQKGGGPAVCGHNGAPPHTQPRRPPLSPQFSRVSGAPRPPPQGGRRVVGAT